MDSFDELFQDNSEDSLDKITSRKEVNPNHIPSASSMRKEESNIDLINASLTTQEKRENGLAQYLEQPAEEGFRGFLTRLGISMPPSAEEVAKRKQIYKAREEQFAMRSRLQKDRGKRSIFAVFSEKGGAGKSTTSALLAFALAQFGGKSVALAEVNPHRGTLADKMGTPTDKCLVDLIDSLGNNTNEEFYGTDPRDFMPQVEGLSVNVLAGNVAKGPQRYSTSAQDVIMVAKSLSNNWSTIVLDNGTDIEDSGEDWSQKSAAFGSFAVASSLVLITNPDVGEADRIVNSTLNLLEERASDKTISSKDAEAWRQLRRSVVLVIVDKIATNATKKMITEGDGELIGSEKAFEVYQKFHSKVRGVVIVPYDPALATTPVNFQSIQGRTKKAAMKLADLVWSHK